MPNLPINPEYNIYVGARYVPQLMGEWSDTVEYEPLSIVLYQGNSYTSRTFVPAGTLPTNTDYWALTGNYNAQIEQYRQEVAALQDNVDENTINIAALQDDVGISDFIFVGDSYGDQENEWPDILKNTINKSIPGTHSYFNACVGGARFYLASGTNTYLNNLKNIASQINKPENVKYIIVCGGYNDKSSGETNIYIAAQSFFSYCRETYVNAKVFVGMIGWSLITADQTLLLLTAQYYNNLKQFGYIPLKNMFTTLMATNLFLDDNFHPNTLGETYLARNIFSAVFGGSNNNILNSPSFRPTVLEPYTMGTQPVIFLWTREDSCELFLNSLNFGGTTLTCNGSLIEIYDCTGFPLADNNGDVVYFLANVSLHDSTHDIVTTAFVSIKNGKIAFRIRAYENNEIVTLKNFTVSFYNMRCVLSLP